MAGQNADHHVASFDEIAVALAESSGDGGARWLDKQAPGGKTLVGLFDLLFRHGQHRAL